MVVSGLARLSPGLLNVLLGLVVPGMTKSPGAVFLGGLNPLSIGLVLPLYGFRTGIPSGWFQVLKSLRRRYMSSGEEGLSVVGGFGVSLHWCCCCWVLLGQSPDGRGDLCVWEA